MGEKSGTYHNLDHHASISTGEVAPANSVHKLSDDRAK